MKRALVLLFLVLALPASAQVSPTVEKRVRRLETLAGAVVNVKDPRFGAKCDGVTDDTTAIAAARLVSTVAPAILSFGGKCSASGFWENLSPLAAALEYGNANSYRVDVAAAHPILQLRLFNGTPQSGAGFAGYGARFDGYTKTSVDVASTVTLAALMQAYSTNSGGSATTNNTNQVALLANAGAMDAASSAPVTGINAIASSAYTGAIWQPITGMEIDVAAANPPGFFGDASKNTATGLSVMLGSGSPQDASIGIGVDTSKAGGGFLHGALISGVKNTGLTIARNTVTPTTGVWVSAAGTYGMYVGAKVLATLQPGQVPAFDASHNPTVGIALGQRAATSGDSNILRWAYTDGASAEIPWDAQAKAATGNLAFSLGGTSKVEFTPSGLTVGTTGTGTVAGRHLTPVSTDRGDTSQTLTVGTDAPIQRWATALTVNRTVTCSTTGAANGDTFRVVRSGLGAFTLDVCGLKTIPSATAAFVDVAYNGTAWVLTGYGAL